MIETPGDTRALAEREADYDAFVAANLRRNFTAHFVHGMFRDAVRLSATIEGTILAIGPLIGGSIAYR